LQLDETMRQLDRLASLGSLSAGLAHEMKNAFVPVKTCVELIAERNSEPELVDMVKRELTRIEGILSRMMRLGSPARAARLRPVRLHEVLDHSFRLLRHQFSLGRIHCERIWRADQDLVLGDEAQLEQVFVNLLTNALEAMPQGGNLTIRSENNGSRRGDSETFILVSISDTGYGIQSEFLNRLFDPFFTTKENGTGLGLPISQRILEEHNGSISVESEVQKGAIFRVWLPVCD
jgi:signal transduction histidine kinase